jgi:hypothetical protein
MLDFFRTFVVHLRESELMQIGVLWMLFTISIHPF